MSTSPRSRAPMTLERLVRQVQSPPRSERTLRYRGDDRAVALSVLPERDRAAARGLYAVLMEFDAALRSRATEPDEPPVAEALAVSFDLERAFETARVLGAGAEKLDDDVRYALHDARGGALTSLIIEVQRARAGRGERRVRALRTMTTDHLKVMRNALLELDETRRTADLEPSEHSIERLAETLARVTWEGARGSVHVDVQRSFEGGITMCCVELGALDRAALNLLNNAVRHSMTDEVKVALVPATQEPGSDLRVCIANAVDDAQVQALRARFGASLARVFVEPFSTTGSGDGLKICVDFVAAAYGLVRDTDAVRSGLVGAVLDDGWFIAWLHWPAVA